MVLIRVGGSYLARKTCEHIENSQYASIEECMSVILKHLDKVDKNGIVQFYSLSNFMDLCNNQEIELEDYFITYVNIFKTTL